jgi:hypothetical protein
MMRRIAFATVALTLFPRIVLAADAGAIEMITLSSGGVAEISRKTDFSADGRAELDVPLDQVDDFLKTAVLSGGNIMSLALAGPAPLEETFRHLPFSADSLTSLPGFLSTIAGTSVTVSSGGKTVQGRVLGVEASQVSESPQRPLLSVINSGQGLQTLSLGADTTVTIDDADVREKLAKAAAAMGRANNDKSRLVVIRAAAMSGPEARLRYMIAAPIWKTSYRITALADGKAKLQGFATLENASGEDWNNVTINLTAADPVTLKQRLHQLYWKDRAEVEVNTQTSNRVAADTGNIGIRAPVTPASVNKASLFRADNAGSGLPAAEAPAPADNEVTNTAADFTEPVMISENDTTARFQLPGTYNLSNGDSLSVPIVDAAIPSEMVSIYRGGTGVTHPVAAIMIKNSTENTLPGGILTVYDGDTGYVGDAQLLSFQKNDTRIAAFATDRKVTITEEQQPDTQIADIRVVDGAIRVSEKLRSTTTYRISGALDGDRTVVIEHPIRSGWSFSSSAEDGRTTTHQRLKTSVKAGQHTQVVAIDEQVQSQTYGFLDVQPSVLLNWSSSAPDKAVAEKFSQLAKLRQAQADVELAVQRSDEKLQTLRNDQERIRENIAAVPENSDLKAKYIALLDQSESAITHNAEVRDQAQGEADQLNVRIRDMIRNF